MTVRLDRLTTFERIVSNNGASSQYFQLYMQQVIEQIEDALNSVIDAQNAAAAADAAAIAANAAADNAQTAATTAQAAADGAGEASALATSGTSGLTITATDAGADVTITISAHTRVYGDGTSVAVSGGSLTGRPYSTDLYIYYDDATRAGGAVAYQSTISQSSAAQTGDRHSLGAVRTPAAAAGPVTGAPNLPPGVVLP